MVPFDRETEDLRLSGAAKGSQKSQVFSADIMKCSCVHLCDDVIFADQDFELQKSLLKDLARYPPCGAIRQF
jgi:hypothetical protein